MDGHQPHRIGEHLVRAAAATFLAFGVGSWLRWPIMLGVSLLALSFLDRE